MILAFLLVIGCFLDNITSMTILTPVHGVSSTLLRTRSLISCFIRSSFNGIVSKLAAYVVLGINADGKKEILTIEVGENESSKYWFSVLNSLKNRGVQDILILCSDGLTGIKEAMAAAFPKREQQRCIVHMVRNTLKCVANKDMKEFAKELKTICTAPDEKNGSGAAR